MLSYNFDFSNILTKTLSLEKQIIAIFFSKCDFLWFALVLSKGL